MTQSRQTICPVIASCGDTHMFPRSLADRVRGGTGRDHSSGANRSIFQRIVDIADSISKPASKITVVDKRHYNAAASQIGEGERGTLVAEPAGRDTAVSVFLALSHIRSHSPGAIVVLLPGSHVFYPENQFIKALKAVTGRASMLNDHVVVVGVPRNGSLPPHGSIRPDVERGWIADFCLRSTESFVDRRHSQGTAALWNTMILVAKAETLWKMGRLCFPEIVRPFERYRSMLGTGQESAVLDEIYQTMPHRNLLRDLLQPCSRQVAIMEVSGAFWCDATDMERMPPTPLRLEEASWKAA